MSPTKANKQTPERKNVKSPTKSKTPERKSPTRKPKIYKLPVYKVKKIMKRALAVTRNNDVEAISQDAQHLAIRATEVFLVELIRQAYIRAGQPKELTYDHVAELVHTEPALKFPHIRELVPRRQKYEDYLKAQKNKKKKESSVVWINCDETNSNESLEKRLTRLISDKYVGLYYRTVLTGDKSALCDKNYLKQKLKTRKV